MQINFTQTSSKTKATIIPMLEGNLRIDGLSASEKKYVEDVLQAEPKFTGKNGQTLVIRTSAGEKVVLVGVGKVAAITSNTLAAAAAPLYKTLVTEGVTEATVRAEGVACHEAADLAAGLLWESYEFKKYKTAEKPTALSIDILTYDHKKAVAFFEPLQQTIESTFFASDLANEPANVLNPVTYADKIMAELAPLGVKVTVLDEKEMAKLNMNAALAVGQGSVTPPRMVVMEYDGTGGTQDQPLALVGKGITFDTGGISLKPSANMGDMTLDMGGSAAVVGAMRALALTKSKNKVVAIVGLAENMPDGKAYRPGDIVTSMNGKTIFIGNTDAEGRLVLADALTYIQRTHNPHTVIDLATLTGAAVVAFGKELAPVYSNDNTLTSKFNAASKATGEKVWEVPITSEAVQAVHNTPLADLTNNATGPGSITAAAFLHEFIEQGADGNDKCAWMHIDMAGPGIPGTIRKGWGVRLLTDAINNQSLATKQKKSSKPDNGGSGF